MRVEGAQLNVIEAALIPQPGDISLLETYLHMVDVAVDPAVVVVHERVRPLLRRDRGDAAGHLRGPGRAE